VKHEDAPTNPPRKLSTPLVLAAASAMISIGLVAALGPGLASRTRRADEAPAIPPLRVDTRTPEATAESYLDAYRRREHQAAIALSVEDAQADARERMTRDERATPEERQAKARIWDRMAAPRLRFVVEAREARDGGRLYLAGRAEGRFLEQPYVREVAFELAPEADAWRVARMELGEIVAGPRLSAGSEGP
jgi:hypothetical protein